MNKMRVALYLGVVFLLGVSLALIAGIIMDFVGSEPADTLKAGGATFLGTMVVGTGVIRLFHGDGPDDPDGPPA
ncbi:hypothetical protein [Streptomyces coeruleorubidus]|uniref:hypothetical protein n=1 Tax=Streptomyces coeruleorubidus TaxID=116188 RepID=UPI0037912ED9